MCVCMGGVCGWGVGVCVCVCVEWGCVFVCGGGSRGVMGCVCGCG